MPVANAGVPSRHVLPPSRGLSQDPTPHLFGTRSPPRRPRSRPPRTRSDLQAIWSPKKSVFSLFFSLGHFFTGTLQNHPNPTESVEAKMAPARLKRDAKGAGRGHKQDKNRGRSKQLRSQNLQRRNLSDICNFTFFHVPSQRSQRMSMSQLFFLSNSIASLGASCFFSTYAV